MTSQVLGFRLPLTSYPHNAIRNSQLNLFLITYH